MTTDILLAASLKNFKKFSIGTTGGTTSYSFGPLFDAKGFTIDWGDGTVDSKTSHTYASASFYTITVKYTKLNAINNSASDSSNILTETTIFLLEENSITDATYMYYQDTNLSHIDSMWLKRATSVGAMFSGCTNLFYFNELLTEDCLNFAIMFDGCSSLTDPPLFNTSKGVSFNGMFQNCIILETIPTYDTSNGTNFAAMFNGCQDLSVVPALDMSKGADFTSIFTGCRGVSSILAYGFKANLDVSPCLTLGHDALVVLLNNLGTTSGATLTYPAIISLTSSEQAIATNKGWSLSAKGP